MMMGRIVRPGTPIRGETRLPHRRPGKQGAALEAAINRLPVLTREILLLSSIDGLPLTEIADRLAIDCLAVEACLAESLSMICAMLEGEAPRRWRCADIEPAERQLRQRHRDYCEQIMRRRGMGGAIIWDDDGDNDQSVARAMLEVIPARIREVFILNRVEGLRSAQIARRTRTFRWIIMRRMLSAIRTISRGPMPFEAWLRQQSA